MSYSSKISDSEWEIMKVIWENPYCTASYVINCLEASKDWKPKTIKTLIRRLLEKNIISFEPYGREYKYYALISEGECVKIESKSFLHRVYRGSLKNMIVSFIEEEELTTEDLEELRRMLKERK